MPRGMPAAEKMLDFNTGPYGDWGHLFIKVVKIGLRHVLSWHKLGMSTNAGRIFRVVSTMGTYKMQTEHGHPHGFFFNLHDFVKFTNHPANATQ